MTETTLRRQAVLTHMVAPRLARLENPVTTVDRVTNTMVGLMQAELRDRRQVLGDGAFVACMIEEIAARVVILADMAAEREAP
ncbi:hypothetical protein [Methylobacterium radiotolerans]|uniref:Uncharacterized protein n=1 Tax=Methylobacterium radiotolerans (strain ATCC 27329 / DSM 1819 / JCM 2831 / NBRC 15690 / NCIMB 10815 / 0-1) TaxID=426355 RepID=B1LXE2_METRJ|nr:MULTISPECIES: hypothetical protein [Methylobacterium]ACB27263.1 hypothetical protein Mrad2831_5316 [Methylobacterium radiotolerans JCM 2831]GEM98240.1 hypothetical protein MRA01_27800 [Methylobacterium radiotolerans]